MDNGVSRFIVADPGGLEVAAQLDRGFMDGRTAVERYGTEEEGVILGGISLRVSGELQDPSLGPRRAQTRRPFRHGRSAGILTGPCQLQLRA